MRQRVVEPRDIARGTGKSPSTAQDGQAIVISTSSLLFPPIDEQASGESLHTKYGGESIKVLISEDQDINIEVRLPRMADPHMSKERGS